MKIGPNNPNWKGGTRTLRCERCDTAFSVKPGRAFSARCCSLACWNVIQSERGVGFGRKKPWASITCRECGRSFEVQPSRVGRRAFCSRACQSSWRKRCTAGARNPGWTGGVRNKLYPPEYYSIRSYILERDGGRCVVPMCRTNDSRVHVHHIDFDKRNNKPENLITTCPSCNARANFNRLLWTSVLSELAKWRSRGGIVGAEMRGALEINPLNFIAATRKGREWNIQSFKP